VDEAFVKKVLLQMAAALLVCHRRKGGAVMHRDLKPANIFLDRPLGAQRCDLLGWWD
jgi:NIMA (never in mitosis gene a)-related kinase